MDTSIGRTKHIFVVEMWREGSPDETLSWRGMVKHVAHGEQRYFVDFGDLTRFLMLRLQADHSPEGDQS
ncbi:MAG TPA: hypothetical protein VII69_00275 [Candidatus Eremiobacteraceae bacterium]